MNKSLLTNIVAILICIGAYAFPDYAEYFFTVSIFALSGGLTNWLAVHMLFEKIPLLYGSGVISNRFEDFKAGIKTLIVSEFFTREHIERFFKDSGPDVAENILEKVDFDRVFAELTDAIAVSNLGSMLAMVGGKKALEPLRDPVTEKLKNIIVDLANDDEIGRGNSDFTQSFFDKVQHIIDNRLDELTPEHVKKIVEDMIRKHLGWLVVWGGVFGGIIGLAVSVLQNT
jgi:uncharacterized membrane protein YheB (UPF0754 family)